MLKIKNNKGIIDPIFLYTLIVILLISTTAITILTLTSQYKKSHEEKENEVIATSSIKEEYEDLNGKDDIHPGKTYRNVSIEGDIFEEISQQKLIEKIENKETFYLYIGDPKCPWCRSIIEQAEKSFKENGISKVYYLNIWDEEGNEILRDKYEYKNGELKQIFSGTEEYKQLLSYFDNVLKDYTLSSDDKKISVGEKRIFAPNYFFIEEGKAIKMVSGKPSSLSNPYDELTEEIIKEEKDIFDEFLKDGCLKAC